MFLEILQVFHNKTLVLECLFNEIAVLGLKRDSNTDVLSFFIEHLRGLSLLFSLKTEVKFDRLKWHLKSWITKVFFQEGYNSEFNYRIYLKERLCSKERFHRIAAPFLTWSIWWAPPSNGRPTFLSKEALFWKIVFKGGAHLGST